MAVDYDIVIIGGSQAGRYAAVYAAQLRATVALVEPVAKVGGQEKVESRKSKVESSQCVAGVMLSQTSSSPVEATGVQKHYSLVRETEGQGREVTSHLTPHILTQIGQLTQQLTNASQFGVHFDTRVTQYQVSVKFAEAMQWAKGVVANLEDQTSPAVLASLGIDFIQGTGQFVSQPRLAFETNQRQLLARSYLIATNSRPAIPEIEGLQIAGYITASEIWQFLTSPAPPKRWVILGGDPNGCQLAQSLARLGLDVTLIVKRPYILAKEDPEIAQLVQAILEAEGVRVLTSTTVTQVKRIENKKWIQAGNEAIESDEVLLCAGQQPDITGLNLEAVGVKLQRSHRLQLNEKLQTTNRRIYACGDAIGGYQFTNIANYEAKIALKNALFFPGYKVDYYSIPWIIFSDPPLARVGLTEVQARHRYRDVLVLRQNFKIVAAAQIRDEITGVCKLIVRRNGIILGAAIVGSQAGELINVIALVIARRLKVGVIASLAPVYPSLSEILQQTAAEYFQARLNSNPTLQNLLEGFFNFRRSN